MHAATGGVSLRPLRPRFLHPAGPPFSWLLRIITAKASCLLAPPVCAALPGASGGSWRRPSADMLPAGLAARRRSRSQHTAPAAAAHVNHRARRRTDPGSMLRSAREVPSPTRKRGNSGLQLAVYCYV